MQKLISKNPWKLKSAVQASEPIVRRLFEILDEEEYSGVRVAEVAGIYTTAISKWRLGLVSPRLITFTAVANAMGYDLCLVKRDD